MEQDLAAWVADELGTGDVTIDGLRRTSAGFSRENWVFDLLHDGQRRPMIARRDPTGSVLRTDRVVETAVLRALEATAVPAPIVVWSDPVGERLGRPTLVMERGAGDCDWFVLNSDRPMEVRIDIAHQLADLLAAIHQVDWRAAGLESVLDDPGKAAAERAVDHWESELRAVQLEPWPELELIIGWLRDHAPAPLATTIVHGDYKPGNVLLVGDRVSLVLDWETAHLGDPQEDLGWVTNPLRAAEHTIPGRWSHDDIVRRWSERTGWTPDPDAIRWWNVLANFKLTVISLTGTHAFVEGRMDSVHQPPIALFNLLFDLAGIA